MFYCICISEIMYSVYFSFVLQSKHEVILSGAVHKLCSDACFQRFRTVNNLSMAGCASCGSFCHNKPLMLKLEDSSKTVCNTECLAKYKEVKLLEAPNPYVAIVFKIVYCLQTFDSKNYSTRKILL